MKNTLIGISVLLAAVWWWKQPPSASRIVAATEISIEQRFVEHRDLRYSASWGGETEHAGDLRVFSRAYHKAAPFITHEAVLTTGQFSDPSVVEVSPIRRGSMHWRSRIRPQGTLIVLHFIPQDTEVLDDLTALETGDRVRFVGREVSDQRLVADSRHSIRLNHNNHRFLLVTEVRVLSTSS